MILLKKKNEIKPNLINPGDTVVFEQISKDQFEEGNG